MSDGLSQLLYLHVGVQSFKEEAFAERVANCYHRIRAGCGEDVVTLVVLADLDPNMETAVLDLLELRFGRISEDLREAIREVTDDDRLAQLLRAAATCEDIEVLSAEV